MRNKLALRCVIHLCRWSRTAKACSYPYPVFLSSAISAMQTRALVATALSGIVCSYGGNN